MKLYTSYWAQVRNFPRNLVGLNTTVWPPRWRPMGKDKNGIIVVDCPPLKPGAACEGLCNGKCEPKHPKDCKFLETYYNQLEQIEWNHFMSQLQTVHDNICAGEQFDDVDFAFIVFEKYDNPCSERQPIQKWLTNRGIEINEWSKT